MKRPGYICSAAILSFLCAATCFELPAQSPATAAAPKSPPVAAVKPVIDSYGGIQVSDPYRYMEDIDSPGMQSWMKEQDAYTRGLLTAIPGRRRLLQRIAELDSSASQISARQLPGDLYLVSKRLAGENVFKIYRRTGLNGPDALLVDPEKITLAAPAQAKGKNAVWGWAASADSRYLAVGIIPGGSELDGELRVFEIATGREIGDVIPHIGAEAWEPYWLPDNHSFVYGRLQDLPPGAPPAEVRQKFRAYKHVLGTEAAKDVPVFGYGIVPSIKVDPSLIASVQVQPDSVYALGVLNGSTTPNSAYYLAPAASVGKPNPQWRKIADFADGVTSVAIHGDDLYLLTYKDAPRYKVVRMSARGDGSAAETVVPGSTAIVRGIHPASDALYVDLLDGGVARLLRVPYGSHPQTEKIPLPFEGLAGMVTDPRLPGALLAATSWTKSFKEYWYNPAAKQVIDTKIQPPGAYDSPANLESIEVKVTSHDGVAVPLSIVYRKGLKKDGSNPTLLEGYGAYGASMDPYFEPASLAWYEQGGVHAMCHVRGGGEYGEEWHLAGKGASKPNTWRDFIACAQYLIDQKYTSSKRLAGAGTSAGGILIGRAITERPDLFAAAVDNVGMSDTLRSELTQNGQTNIPEFGSTKTADGFKALMAMSAYHHIEQGVKYPAVLFTTGMNDPRVDPWQMAKMAARMQSATTSGKPVLLRVDFAGGHGGMGGTQSQWQEALADRWSFLLWQFGVPEFQPRQ